MSFQMIVLWTAILIFIGLLCFIGYNIYSSQYNVAWPPSIPDCPDYWTATLDGTTTTCTSSTTGYNKCPGTTSFKTTDHPNLCDKFDFATACKPPFNWSGVSNSLKCT